jgi:hypothetical protein
MGGAQVRSQGWIGAGVQAPCGVAVAGNHIYWADSESNTIGRANLDGTRVNPSFITGASVPCGITAVTK